jgi:hypothetical protein
MIIVGPLNPPGVEGPIMYGLEVPPRGSEDNPETYDYEKGEEIPCSTS